MRPRHPVRSVPLNNETKPSSDSAALATRPAEQTMAKINWAVIFFINFFRLHRFNMISRYFQINPRSSQAQKNFTTIKEVHEGKGQSQSNDGDEQFARAGRKSFQTVFQIPAGQSRADAPESAQQIAGDINGDRVHPDPDERLAPDPFLPDIHHEKKTGQQQGAATARHQHE